MKKLRSYYERELGALQEFSQEFAAAYPAQAQRLGMMNGAVDDPHVERFIQATALSNARIAHLIDNNDTKITEALLSVNYPHYLQPFPATAIVRIGRDSPGPAVFSSIPRGSMMSAGRVGEQVCRFRTAFDVALVPVALASFTFNPLVDFPATLPCHPSVVSSLSIGFTWPESVDLRQLNLEAWRLYIDAEPSLCAAIRDAMFMHVQNAYLESDGCWTPLSGNPINPVGFDPQDALIPFKATGQHAFRLLTEYFAFPEKFNFIDLEWPSLAQHASLGTRRMTLHLALSAVVPDSPMARKLASVSGKNLVPGCTPAVNLFRCRANPIELTQTSTDYALVPDGFPASAVDIYSVDKVFMAPESQNAVAEFRPYYSLRHGEADGKRGRYYLVRRDPLRAASYPGSETRISLVDLERNPFVAPNASVSVELTCTSRNSLSQLSCGAPDGDLKLEAAASGPVVHVLRRPSTQYRIDSDIHWRLISLLSLGPCFLRQGGSEMLKEVLFLHDLPRSAVTQRQIAGIKSLDFLATTAWLRNRRYASPVHGTEIHLTVDEDAFAGTGLHLFAQVLDHFFGLQVSVNSFSRLVVLSHSDGKELLRCPPRHGAIQLI